MITLENVPDRVTALVCSVLLVMHALVLVRATMSRCPCGRGPCEVCGACARCIRCALVRVKHRLTQGDAKPEPEAGGNRILAALVQDALRAERQRFMREVGRGCSILTAILLLTTVVNILLQIPRWQTPAQSLITCMLYPISWYMTFCECNIKALRCCTAVLFVGMGAYMAACFPQMELAIISILTTAFPRFLTSLFLMDLRTVYCANAVCSAMVLPVMLRAEDATSGRVSRWHALIEVFVSLTICACAKAFKVVIERSCRQALELQSSRNESLAAVGVLKAVCDAVVRLDDEMQVADQETKLAALLLHGPGRALTGSEFLQYVSTQDQQLLFREWLRAPVEVGNEKGSFDTMLRDSTGSNIGVEMFHVPYEYLPGTLHHFIGIRETSPDKWPRPDLQNLQRRTTRGQRSPRAPSGHVAAGQPGPDSRDGFPVPQNPSEGSSESLSADGNQMLRGEVNVCADGDQMNRAVQEIDSNPVFKFEPSIFRVLGCSDGFSIGPHGPPRRGSFMSDRMKTCDVNTKFYRDCSKNASALRRRARATTEPVEIAYASAIIVTPVASREDYRLTLKVILSSSWTTSSSASDARRSLAVLATAVVLATCVERWGADDPPQAAGSPRHSDATSRSFDNARPADRTPSVSL